MSDRSSDMFDSDENNVDNDGDEDPNYNNDDDQQEEEEDESWKDADFLCFSGAASSSKRNSSAAAAAGASSSDDEDDDDDEAQLQLILTDAPWMNGGGGGGARRTNPISINHLNRIHPLVRLHNEIVWFVRLIEPTREEIQAREKLVQRIRTFVQKTFASTTTDDNGKNSSNNHVRIEVFGSQATNLFLPTSDIDIVVYTKAINTNKTADEENDTTKSSKSTNPLHQFAEALRDEWMDELSYLDVIENTKVPLVKFTHAATNVSVDVCFDQETGPPAAQLMIQYLDELPPLRPLTFCFKYFLVARGLNEPYSGGVGSFLLQLMIVSFLQQRERFAVHFQRPTLNNLGCMLLEFLQLFGTEFNYATTAISVRSDGYYFPKGHPDTRATFFNPSRPLSLALENPLDTSHDVGTSSFRMPIVQRAFGTAYRILLAHVTDHTHPSGISTAEALASIFGQGDSNSAPTPSNSILASILPPNQEMQQRALYKQKHHHHHHHHAASAATTIALKSPTKKSSNRNNNSKRKNNNNNNKSNNNNSNGRKRQRR